ncbi:MAG: NCS2 family permease [Melioribacteraceae bacterium]
MANFIKKMENYFEMSKYNTTWKTEILAGVSIYLSLAYIFIVNPSIMSQTGMSTSAVLFATIFASAFSTLYMGIRANLPFALAPGLEMNGFFTFVVVGTLGLTWNQALGAVFWSGILCIILSLLPVRIKIINSIPNGLKKAMAVSVGIFVITIGLFLSGIFEFTDGKISGFGSPFTAKGIALFIGLFIALILGIKKLKFPAGMLVAIIMSAIYCKTQGIVQTEPAEVSTEMFSAVFKLDLIPTLKILPVFLIFFLIDFYGSIGKFIGLTASTNLTEKDGTLPRIEKAIEADGIGTSVGALVGTSSIITFVESSIGIAIGGRTGIVAVVCGILMILSLVFTPLVGLVPVEATAGILLYVGYLIIRDTWEEIGLTKFFYVIAILMALISLFTFSLDKAMFLGFFAYSVKQIYEDKKVNWYLAGSTILIAIGVILPYFMK